MTRRSSYKTLQRAIAKDDKHSIGSRWEYGRRILGDPKKMAASGKSLRNGAIEALIADAAAVGSTLSRGEIQRRIQCARAYATDSQLRHAMTQFETWFDLIQAGFPAVDTDETPAPESALDDIEESAADAAGQLSLFPDLVRGVPLQEATLRHLVAYDEWMCAMTASYARTDARRGKHLAELRAAVGDDLDATYAEAVTALHSPATT